MSALNELFTDNATTEENGITVKPEFYYASLPEGITKEQSDAVLGNIATFTKTSLDQAADPLIALLHGNDEFDGVTATYETGVEGIQIVHNINRDSNAEAGIDPFSSIEFERPESGMQESYNSIYEKWGAALGADDSETEEE